MNLKLTVDQVLQRALCVFMNVVITLLEKHNPL